MESFFAIFPNFWKTPKIMQKIIFVLYIDKTTIKMQVFIPENNRFDSLSNFQENS